MTPTKTADESSIHWHALSVTETFEQLESRPEGLSQNEVTERLVLLGSNAVVSAKRFSVLALLLAQFKNVLILILLFALSISIYLGHTLEPIVIGVIVLFSVGLGFAQEYRAERAMESLKALAAPLARVLRDGKLQSLPAHELVPGDIVRLNTGDLIPADLRWIEVVNLKVNEAPLTGESQAIEKQVDALIDGKAIPTLGDRRNLGFAGTTVVYGRGTGLVFGTGMRTELGHIVGLLRDTESRRTPLKKNLDRIGNVLIAVTLLVVAIIVGAGMLHGEPLHEMLLFGIALAVAVTPEALPAVVTISLALGANRMVSRHALIRRLTAVETLGCTSVICVDKTGTLTRDEMTVRKIWTAGDVVSVSGVGYDPVGRLLKQGQTVTPTTAINDLLQAAILNNDASLERIRVGQWQVQGDSTEGALIVAARKAGLVPAELRTLWPRIGEIPFTSESKRMTTLHQGPNGESLVCAKGAVEVILAACSTWYSAEGEQPLDTATRTSLLTQAETMAQDALRVLAIAQKLHGTLADAGDSLCFLGLVGMMDPPRLESAEAVARCAGAGIKVIMLTGDHPATARAIAREVGLLRKGLLITGAELSELDEAGFQAAVDHIEVYARVSPEHKLRIVEMLQREGRVVAMTGDGVNDAPALKQADIGIAMGVTGTDAAREAADMLLTDDNFASIVAAIEEGRSIFSNIRKYLMYLLSSNIGEIGLIACATALGLPLPLSAVQILYVNLATDGLPALALAIDPAEASLMRQTPRDPEQSIFTPAVMGLMLVSGIWSTLVNLGSFWWALSSGRPVAEAMTLNFVTLTLIQFFNAYNFRSDRASVFNRPFANRWLNRAILWELLLLVGIIHLPFLELLFGVVALTWQDWLTATLLAVSVIPVLELAKRVRK